MLKKTVTYEDPFNPGVEVTEDLYFNLTKAELVEMEIGHEGEGGLKEHLETVARAENGQQIMDEMKGIIFKAYGVKNPNGKFIKTQAVREEFESSEAYSTLFMEMVTDADAAVKFVEGIMPKGLEELGQETLPVDPLSTAMEGEYRPNLTAVNQPPKEDAKLLSRTEILEMDGNELRSGLAEGRYILSNEQVSAGTWVVRSWARKAK